MSGKWASVHTVDGIKSSNQQPIQPVDTTNCWYPIGSFSKCALRCDELDVVSSTGHRSTSIKKALERFIMCINHTAAVWVLRWCRQNRAQLDIKSSDRLVVGSTYPPSAALLLISKKIIWKSKRLSRCGSDSEALIRIRNSLAAKSATQVCLQPEDTRCKSRTVCSSSQNWENSGSNFSVCVSECGLEASESGRNGGIALYKNRLRLASHSSGSLSSPNLSRPKWLDSKSFLSLICLFKCKWGIWYNLKGEKFFLKIAEFN